MYQRPDMLTNPGVNPQGQALDPRKIQDNFEDFYEDPFEELSKYGLIESLNICDNLVDHMFFWYVTNMMVDVRDAMVVLSAAVICFVEVLLIDLCRHNPEFIFSFDGERLPLAVKELGTCDLYSQNRNAPNATHQGAKSSGSIF
ncbi:hypothetical protein ACFX2C_004635 [Malus domestica]